MNEIKRYEFEGRVFDARVRDGEEWFTAAQVAEMLGHESARAVRKLYAEHSDEFMPHETCEVLGAELGNPEFLNSEKPARRGNPRIKVRLFSMDGVEHLAILAKKAGVKLRRWCIDLRGRFRRGETAEITREQVEALVKAAVTVAIGQRDEQHRADLAARDRRIDALLDTQQSISHALAETAKAAGRTLQVYGDAPEIQALDRAYRQRHAPAPALFPGAAPGEPKKDEAHEWLKATVVRVVIEASKSGPVRPRGLVRRVAEEVGVPRRFVRDAVGDLYLEGAIRREHGSVIVREQGVAASPSSPVNRVAGLDNANGNGGNGTKHGGAAS